MAITYSVLFSAVSAWAIRGLFQARGQILDNARRSAKTSTGDAIAFITSDGPVEFHDLAMEGHSTIVEALKVERRGDGDWYHYAMNHTNRLDGYEHHSIFMHNPVCLFG